MCETNCDRNECAARALVRGVRIRAIAATDSAWGIGKDGALLARLPGDLRYFREKTLGGILVMGRRTLESLPGGRPLDGRKTIVLTHNADFVAEGAIAAHSLSELAEAIGRLRAEDGGDRPDVFIAGGAVVYEELLPYTDSCLITRMDGNFGADAFFPNLDEDEGFSLTWEDAPIEENGVPYRFTEYSRRGGGEK
ncbi:MAG: dihydrofolate reductase [Clostridiales Family XIII bacterium]|jgi:dihydrofolate reductase|nr:dihydrofolate reductase [Clostridiales Family XIII bacterium]